MIRGVKELEWNVGEPQTSDWKSAWDLMEKMGRSWVSCESFKISAQPNWNDLIAWSNNQSSARSCLATSNLGYGGVVLRQWKLSKHALILDSRLRHFTAFSTDAKMTHFAPLAHHPTSSVSVSSRWKLFQFRAQLAEYWMSSSLQMIVIKLMKLFYLKSSKECHLTWKNNFFKHFPSRRLHT